MDFSTLGKRCGRNDDPNSPSQLAFLISACQQWQAIDARIQSLLPVNLRPHIRIACLENCCLVVLAANHMAASRLKMIGPSLLTELTANYSIENIRVKITPTAPPPTPNKQLALSPATGQQINQTANRLKHHPQLAQSLRRLAAQATGSRVPADPL